MKVSMFKEFNRVTENLELPVIMEQIRAGKYKAQVEKLRELVRQGLLDEYREQKRFLPAFTPSGRFDGGRKLQFLKEYSGILVLDLDDLAQDQLVQVREAAEQIRFTYACFVSPGGRGLKILVRIFSRPVLHKQAFIQVQNYYERQLNVLIDPSGKDVTRLCFVSWDELLYFNPSSTIFKTYVNLVEEDIDRVVGKIEERMVDITVDYDTWLRIGFSLTDALGEEGRSYFHRVSQFYPDYKKDVCDQQYDRCLHANNTGITASSFFHFARDQGIDTSTCRSLPRKSNSKFQDPNSKEISNSKSHTQNPDRTSPIAHRPSQNSIHAVESFLHDNYVFRFNTVTAKIEYRLNDLILQQEKEKSHIAHPPSPIAHRSSQFIPLTDYIENSIFRHLLANNIRCNTNTLRALLLSDFSPRFNPFTEYFNNLPPWDGSTDHITNLACTVHTTNNRLWHDCFKRWLVASVASVLQPEVINHTAIIFSGCQGIGKTTWLLNLCPIELKNHLFSGTINPNNRDTLLQLSECMFINLDELENMTRSEIGTVKEIITKSAIRVRRAYGHHAESLIRRASFMGSVNTLQFLTDTTGSRRFLCFEVKSIDYQQKVDTSKVFAQAFALMNQGFQYWFKPDEINEVHQYNEQFRISSPEEELLMAYFAPASLDKATEFFTASQIISRVSENTSCNLSLNPGTVIRMGQALKKNGFEKKDSNGLHLWGVDFKL